MSDCDCWCHHSEAASDPLPVPRLEIRYEQVGGSWRNRVAKYALVYRHLCGEFVTVPLGETKIAASRNEPPIEDGKVHLPFRDGAHIYHEMMTLGLPGFAICGDVVTDLCATDPGYAWYKPIPLTRRR
jgi:hypothetical protein